MGDTENERLRVKRGMWLYLVILVSLYLVGFLPLLLAGINLLEDYPLDLLTKEASTPSEHYFIIAKAFGRCFAWAAALICCIYLIQLFSAWCVLRRKGGATVIRQLLDEGVVFSGLPYFPKCVRMLLDRHEAKQNNVIMGRAPSVPCKCHELRELHGNEAEEYADGHLEEVKVDAMWREIEYRCPQTGKKWIMDRPQPELQADGPPRLRIIEEEGHT